MADVNDQTAKSVVITGTSLHPTYFGSMMALLVSMIVSSLSIYLYGVPAYVSEYPESQRAEIFFGCMVIAFLYALRYYFLLSFNQLGGANGDLFTLPAVLKKLTYSCLMAICLLCVVLSGAIMAVRAEWSIAICLLMSGLTLATWFSSFIISHFKNIERVQGYHALDDSIFFLVSLGILLILWFGMEKDMGSALPFIAFGVLSIFVNGLRWFLPAIAKDIRELRSALKS